VLLHLLLHLVLHLLSCFVLHLHLHSLCLLLCSLLCLLACSLLHLLPALFLFSLQLLTSMVLLCFGIKNVQLVLTTRLQFQCGGIGPVFGLGCNGAMGVVDLAVADMMIDGRKLGVKSKTGLIFIDPKSVLRHSLQTLHCSRRPHDSLIGASWVWPLKGGYCYDHVQLQILSSYPGCITAL